MRIATWNVNSIRSRQDRLLAWLERYSPDVFCLQELKTTDEKYPLEEIEKAGYQSAVYGQKTYNGVAVLSRSAADEVRRGFDDGVDGAADEEARLIAARFGDLDVISVYIPNGRTPADPAFDYKLKWIERLRRYLESHHTPEDKVLVCGDYNVAPTDLDVARPEEWAGSVLCHDEARQAFGRLKDWGLTDLFRHRREADVAYSWWDYRMLGFPKGNGLRIDHILGTLPMAEACTDVWIDRDERKGKKPSDHAPVVADFSD
jgi:exodeoxyribonuclease-3